jgi:flagellar motor switch protein FliG
MSAFSSFNDLARLTDREIQMFLREVDQKDLVVALTKTNKAVTQKCLGNMSERVRTFIQEEVDFFGRVALE